MALAAPNPSAAHGAMIISVKLCLHSVSLNGRWFLPCSPPSQRVERLLASARQLVYLTVDVKRIFTGVASHAASFHQYHPRRDPRHYAPLSPQRRPAVRRSVRRPWQRDPIPRFPKATLPTAKRPRRPRHHPIRRLAKQPPEPQPSRGVRADAPPPDQGRGAVQHDAGPDMAAGPAVPARPAVRSPDAASALVGAAVLAVCGASGPPPTHRTLQRRPQMKTPQSMLPACLLRRTRTTMTR